MSEWKTIDSAPKETKVLCYWASEHPSGIGWTVDTARLYVYPRRKQWANPEDSDDEYRDPTHWMPLPNPPV